MLTKVIENAQIAPNVYRMRVSGDTRGITRAGQFVQVAISGFYLRRPLSICDCQIAERGWLDLIYKTVGKGTRALSETPVGACLDMLMGLGNGYDEAVKANRPMLVGGGTGVPPLFWLCKRLIQGGKAPLVALGFNTAADMFLKSEFEELGATVSVATMDGSFGVKGFVTDAMNGDADYVYACGPEPMLKAVHALCGSSGLGGQFSFEERMACGFGACMGCSCRTKYGAKRICADGPVLSWEEIVW